jgi:N-methylhydantoinase B
MTPGSMPIARHLIQEGLILPPVRLVAGGKLNQDVWDLIMANVRTPVERAGDLRAQLAANARGVFRLGGMVEKYGRTEVEGTITALYDYTERLTRALIRDIGAGAFAFEDFLDDDGVGVDPVRIHVHIRLEGETAEVDFTGSSGQQRGSVNAVQAITLSAVAYVFRLLLAQDVPNNAGALRPIRVITPEPSVVDAAWPAPVAGGNVETSQRIVDALLGAFAQALPDRIPAASQGTMNNTLIGGTAPDGRPFTYYETIAGGMGGSPGGPGVSGRHVHMTNTLNTPVEALEFAYPFRVERYAIRSGTGGSGRHPGGDGVRRDIRLLVEAEASLITDRRRRGPYGLQGGSPGTVGENVLIRDGEEIALPAKGQVDLLPGDVLSIRTPGGGGWGYNEENPKK